MKFACSIGIFHNSGNLICRSTDISKCFRGSLCLRDNESQLYNNLFIFLPCFYIQVASNLCFEISVANGVVVKWETIYDERKLFVEVPNTILPDGSKER